MFGTGGRGQHIFLVGASDENLVEIAAMLRVSAQQQKPKAYSGSGRVMRTGTPSPTRRPLERPPAGALAEAYGRFLELPVPVVLAALWVLGVGLRGAVLAASYWTQLWVMAALAQL